MYDVIVVGAGPAGLVCAMSTAKAGLKTVVIEAEPEIPKNLRGSTFHPSSLDMLDDEFGAARPLIKRGLIAPAVQYRRHNKGKIAEFNFNDISDLTKHPYRLQAEQYKLCEILHDMLLNYENVDLKFSTRVVNLKQEDHSVTVSIESGQQIKGAYLVAADGANSIIRQTLNIPFEGFTWPERFLVASTPFNFQSIFTDLASVSYVADPEEWYFLLQIPNGLWRCMFPIRPNELEKEILSDENVQARLNRIHVNSVPYELVHKTLYNVHQRVAKTYRLGRVLLTGDAAHVNNPLGGMGMNGGIHDSFNLAEKLIPVLKGQTDPSSLDLYDKERRTVAMDYVQHVSIQNKNDLETADPAEQAAFDARLVASRDNLKKRRELLLKLSMYSSLGKTVTF